MAERFSGYNQTALDSKGRLALPTRYRTAMGGEVALQRQEQGCLAVYPQARWGEEAQRLNDRSISDPEAAQEFRFRNHRTNENIPVDAAGRVLIPADVRAKVGLDGPLILVGAGDRLELWRSCAYEIFEEREERRMGYDLGLARP